MQILISSRPARTSSLVRTKPVNPFTLCASINAGMSSHPVLLGLPVVVPNSCPMVAMWLPEGSEEGISVGKGPLPTLVVYALVTPRQASMWPGCMPAPWLAFALDVTEEVTNG